MGYDQQRVDEAVLALLTLTIFKDGPGYRAWKGQAFEVMDRLHADGFISDPKSKAKSVIMSEKGLKRSRELFENLFG